MSLKLAKPERRYLRLVLSVFIVALACWYIGANLHQSLDQMQGYPWRENIDVLSLSAATFFLLLHYVVDGAVFAYLARQAQVKVKILEALRIFFLANLGKYVPGKIWTVIGKTYWLGRVGVEKGAAVSTVSIELGLNIAAGAFVCIPLLHWLLPSSSLWSHVPLVALSIPLMVLGLSYVRRPLSRVRPNLMIPISATVGWRAFLVYMFSWLAFGLGFWFLVRTVYPVAIDRFPLALASIGTAWIGGFLMILAPGGIGVREGLLLVMLKQWLPLEIATIVAIGSRIWMTAGELLGLLAVYAIRPRD